jgi:glucose uptake protein
MLTMIVAWTAAHGGHRVPLPKGTLLDAFLCGPVWTLGMMSFTLAVAESGLTLATPIKNTTAVLGTLVGLLFFNETQHTVAWMALLGSAFIVACAVVIGQAGEGSDIHFSISPKGIVYSLLAAFFFAAYTYPLKRAMIGGLDSSTIVLVMSLGIVSAAVAGQLLGGGSLVHWAKQPFRDHVFGALAGMLWTLATLLMNVAIGIIGLAVTWPITNLNTVVAVAFGAFVFHEIHLEKHRGKLAWGVIFALIGVLLLGLSKT